MILNFAYFPAGEIPIGKLETVPGSVIIPIINRSSLDIRLNGRKSKDPQDRQLQADLCLRELSLASKIIVVPLKLIEKLPIPVESIFLGDLVIPYQKYRKQLDGIESLLNGCINLLPEEQNKTRQKNHEWYFYDRELYSIAAIDPVLNETHLALIKYYKNLQTMLEKLHVLCDIHYTLELLDKQEIPEIASWSNRIKTTKDITDTVLIPTCQHIENTILKLGTIHSLSNLYQVVAYSQGLQILSNMLSELLLDIDKLQDIITNTSPSPNSQNTGGVDPDL